MALLKEYEDRTGTVHEAAYHKVTLTNIDWLRRVAHCVVAVFHDQAAREAGKQPVASKVYDFPLTESGSEPEEQIVTSFNDVFGSIDDAGMNPVAAMYVWLKTRDEYSGASDA